MDGFGQILSWLEMLLGVLLIVVILVDVFLTVLYARAGAGIISQRLASLTWRTFKAASRLMPRRREELLAFCGPVILVLLVMTWFLGLALGGALIAHPRLGKSITTTSGPTPTDFITAVYVAGDTMTTVGTSDIAPRTPGTRLFYTFNSFLGLSIITLTLAYLLEIYNALQRRNTLALKTHLASGESGDAVDLVAGLGPGGTFDNGYAMLSEAQAEMAGLKESHHFYPVLFYFRFREPRYAVSRLALVHLDTVSLIKSALSDQAYGWLKETVAVNQLWRASMHLITFLSDSFLPGGTPDPQEPDEATRQRWRERYYAALDRLRQANIQTIEDEETGAETYVSLRARWDRLIRPLAAHMGYAMDVIDPAGANPRAAEQRQPFPVRLRSAG